MTDRAEDICPQCHLPMHRDDARSYGYGGPTHEVSRCVELLLFANRAQAAEIERLEALVVSRVRTSADAVVEIAAQAAEIERLRVTIALQEVALKLHGIEVSPICDTSKANERGDTP